MYIYRAEKNTYRDCNSVVCSYTNIVKFCLVIANFVIMDSGQFTIITLKTLLFVIKFPFMKRNIVCSYSQCLSWNYLSIIICTILNRTICSSAAYPKVVFSCVCYYLKTQLNFKVSYLLLLTQTQPLLDFFLSPNITIRKQTVILLFDRTLKNACIHNCA